MSAEIRDLIRTLARDGWGAPRNHGEVPTLAFVVSEITVSRYMPRRTIGPDQFKRWIAFLHNHKVAIAAMNLFTVPTATLRVLCGFFVLEHGRRHVLHSNATFHPTAGWVTQQIREAFPYDAAPKYLIFDRDSIFSGDVVRFARVTFVSRILPGFPTDTGPSLEKKMKDLNVASNYELVRRLDPFVRDRTVNWTEFTDAVKTAVKAYLPELSTKAELSQITLFLADYYGVDR